jgi:alpha-L-rhamnosidase
MAPPTGIYPAALLGGLQAGGLRAEHQVDPLGVDVARPRLGWVLDERTGPANVWGSGEVRSSLS